MIKKIFLLSAIFFALVNTAIAKVTDPNKCPAIENVKNVPWGIVEDPYGTKIWTLVKENNFYDTNVEWSFLIEPVRAEDKDSAIVAANEILKTTQLFMGPVSDDDQWACFYESNDPSYVIMALSPPPKNPLTVKLPEKNK